MIRYHKIILYLLLFFGIAITALLNSCKKEKWNTDNNVKLNFSSDKLLFDTIFATVGSITQSIRVYNPYNEKIKISKIYLAEGNRSNFRINVDGEAGVDFSDIEIAGKDSIFVFIEVTVDPNNTLTPYVISDSIVFITNGNIQDVDLAAWGQNAHFIVADTYISGLPPFKIVAKEFENVTWNNNLPYVIYGYAVVDSNAILNINEGVSLHFFKNSGLWIYKGGCLRVNGTKELPVTFTGTRLDDYYKDLPGQWDRIWLNESSQHHEINYAVIKNGFIGIQAEILQEDMGNALILRNTKIENMSGAGIFTRVYRVVAGNTVIGNCKQYALALTMGGLYDFRHCTIGNYWNYEARQDASVVINNYFMKDNTVFAGDLDAYFGNCIIYGGNADELEIDEAPQRAVFSYVFRNCIIRTNVSTSDTSKYKNVLVNTDPLFEGTDKFKLWVKENSPAINAGNMEDAQLYPADIEGLERTATPDIGAYEKQR